MSQPDYLPYRSYDSSEADRAYLKVLSIVHYIWGGLTLLFSCFGLIYVVFGLLIFSDAPAIRAAFTPATGPAIAPPMRLMGGMVAGMGGCMTIAFGLLGVLTLVAGRRIAQRRSRIFCMVVAAMNCIWFPPLGTALGVFTFIMLSKDSVKMLYEQSL